MTGCRHNPRRYCTDCQRDFRWPTTLAPDPDINRPGFPRITTWGNLRGRVDAAQEKIAAGLYSAHPEYALRLIELGEAHGLVLAEQHLACLARLINPRHRCTSQACHEQAMRTHGLDHQVWFRRRTEQWAVLSQDYGHHNGAALPGATRIELPTSPYSDSTFATLYLGAAQP